MKIAIILCILYAWVFYFTQADGARLFAVFQHVKTGRYLSFNGKATLRGISSGELFDLLSVGKGQISIVTVPWNNGGKEKYVLDIQNGCKQNSTVKKYEMNKDKNQRWILNSDGSISTACNPDWLLIADNYGVQQVRDKDQVPVDERVWIQTNQTDPSSNFFGK